jgi:hypothetical protein
MGDGQRLDVRRSKQVRCRDGTVAATVFVRRGCSRLGIVLAGSSGQPGASEAVVLSVLEGESRMRRESHVRFCEGGGVRFPSATRLVILCRMRPQVEQALREVRATLGLPRLQPHPTTTRLAGLGLGGDGFAFLGCYLRMVRPTSGGSAICLGGPRSERQRRRAPMSTTSWSVGVGPRVRTAER